MSAVDRWLRRTWARTYERMRRHQLLTALVVLVLVVVPGFVRVEQIASQAEQLATSRSHDRDAQHAVDRTIINGLRADISCVEHWANSYTGSVRAVQDFATVRVDELFAALNQATKGHPAQAMREYRHAAAANRRYHRYLARHPIPGLGLTCRILPPPIKAHPTSTPSASPRATVTRTVRVPGPTVTVTVAGPTVTRTAPRATVTVTAPPGKRRGRR